MSQGTRHPPDLLDFAVRYSCVLNRRPDGILWPLGRVSEHRIVGQGQTAGRLGVERGAETVTTPPPVACLFTATSQAGGIHLQWSNWL
jgi:hypothetical protein